MDIKLCSKRTITHEKAIKILAERGTHVTKEEAELILDFIFKFANLAINQIVKSKLK